MVDEYQDTNRPQYLLIRRLAEVHRNLCVVGDPDQSIYKWRGADLRNILDFEQDFPRSDDRQARTQLPVDADHSRRGVRRHQPEPQPQGQAPLDRSQGRRTASSTSAAATSSRRPISSRERRATALADDVEATVAVLYRTNAQSRTIEDALMREGLAYKVVGGVRFYERKEIKDALAYMRLVINPHDDVSLRRVINVPARGIGKGVMEVDREARRRTLTTRRRSAAAGGRPPAGAVGQLAVGAARARPRASERFTGRAAASLTVFRDLIVSLTEMARQDSVSIAIGKMLDQSGYLQDLREERSEDAEARIENLAELVSAAREYESREAGAVAGRLRRSPVAAVRRRRRSRARATRASG